MGSEIALEEGVLPYALAEVARDQVLRDSLFDSLREAEARSNDPNWFREHVRWPVILGSLREAGVHRVRLSNGLVFEVGADSRIEKALLLSPAREPDHVWEPQTTRLVVALAAGADNVLVGGAYIGDHVLPLAQAVSPRGTVHAFEPARHPFERLGRNVELNRLDNVRVHRAALWDRDGGALHLSGDFALAETSETTPARDHDEVAEAMTIDAYVRREGLSGLELVQLDTEGGEERALAGGRETLSRPKDSAPNLVFEVHRRHVDWSEGLPNTSLVRMLSSLGYQAFGIRDVHGNFPMGDSPVEVVPAASVHLEGPPHGFNMLAVKDEGILRRLGIMIVEGVSPKLLPEGDSPLHRPTGGFPPHP